VSARLEHLAWPFFDGEHRELAATLDAWAARYVTDHMTSHGDESIAGVDAACRERVAALGAAGWLRQCVPAPFGAREKLDVRALALCRETLAYHDGLADFAFAMQGLGSGPIALAGNDALRARYLPGVVAGSAIAAFALSERDAGSDVSAIATTATRDGDGWVLDGEKTWISNGGIAAFYVIFARSGEAPGTRGLTAFVVDADAPGLEIAERIETIAPHPLATLRLRGCRVADAQRIGAPGEGFKVAMRTLDVFRTSVAGAALGFARRAFDAAVERATERTMFGSRLADFQLSQAGFAQMDADLDASALLTYRAAWTRDVLGEPATREAALAKWVATESAQRSIDRAVQFFGGLGVMRGNVAERLYREIRALRIYEGASEVQQTIVARAVLARAEGK
jgi:alkylation response protein AidB-like acyl-CoA dehydrogenase